MTKLEEKLIKLGYETNEFLKCAYWKKIKRDLYIKILFNYDKTKFLRSYIDCCIETQQDIDNLQLAFSVMQKDLEELREYEI